MLVLDRLFKQSPAPVVHEDSARDSDNLVDLGFSQWETSWRRDSLSNRFFDAYLARPRGLDCPYSFVLKALRPEYCGSVAGIALVERERAIGSIDCRRLYPVADYAYPKRVSKTQAARGYVVSPSFRGVTLGSLQAKKREFERKTLDELQSALDDLSANLERYGWGANKISPDSVLLFFENRYPLGGKLINVMLTDFSQLYRTIEPGLFVNPIEGDLDLSPVFDPHCLLDPATFYRPDLSASATQRAFRNLLLPSL